MELIDLKCYGNKNAFAKEIGVSHTHINRMFNIDTRSNSYPSVLKSVSVLKAIMNKFPEITVEWFKGGELKKVSNGAIKKDSAKESVLSEKYLLERLKDQDDKINSLKERFKMLYDQLLFLQNSLIAEKKQNKDTRKLG
ncbi:hypothetical protein [Seonamhaeicola sp.]|uniref:hypothetical protein n=1 Tax=Seonamhaeicola sp. TaxID=1912245 RepID=UPI0035683588